MTLSQWWITIELINRDLYCEERSAHFVEACDFFVDGSEEPVGRYRPKYIAGVIPFTLLRRRKHYQKESKQGHEAWVEVECGLIQSETADFRHTGFAFDYRIAAGKLPREDDAGSPFRGVDTFQAYDHWRKVSTMVVGTDEKC